MTAEAAAAADVFANKTGVIDSAAWRRSFLPQSEKK